MLLRMAESKILKKWTENLINTMYSSPLLWLMDREKLGKREEIQEVDIDKDSLCR